MKKSTGCISSDERGGKGDGTPASFNLSAAYLEPDRMGCFPLPHEPEWALQADGKGHFAAIGQKTSKKFGRHGKSCLFWQKQTPFSKMCCNIAKNGV